MKRETGAFLAKARRALDKARAVLSIDLPDEAGRNAYFAAFHAAQAVIFERLGKATKTHKGVHTAFSQLAKDDQRVRQEFRTFLKQAYDLKTVADYETGSETVVSSVQAAAAIETAERFVVCMADLIDPPLPVETPE